MSDEIDVPVGTVINMQVVCPSCKNLVYQSSVSGEDADGDLIFTRDPHCPVCAAIIPHSVVRREFRAEFDRLFKR